MLVVLIEILRLTERAISSNKGRKATLSVASICICITWYIAKIVTVLWLHLPHHHLLDQVCQTLQGRPVFRVKIVKSVSNESKLLDFVQCTCTNNVFTPIFD